MDSLRRDGHTVLKDGLHADGWLEKGELVRKPVELDRLAKRQAEQIQTHWPSADLIVGVSQCGAVLAAFVARHLALPVAFVNLQADQMTFHRMNVPEFPQRVVLVDDLISTGTDARLLVAGMRRAGHTVLGLSVWTVRQTAQLPELPLLTLWPHPYHTWSAAACPHCAAGEAVRWEQVRE
ncbi:orotate phosphoribosyltransferase [Deinococcus sp. Arct2-2]|uniref:orotate phosphoribosyltransferase n=1 Tax=Deinococcus sp. Arct2-2 TaxID=2568653 RepID=UPI0010A33310|nr:orotate phosphoribosyltransferase [Deinococcus sp. Arct2-2]THF69479.1 orotate phosphoribosyltransferase [Deinococcus sp. Arct2-2]